MKLKILIGILLIILSIAMFIFGVHGFTYRGEFTELFRNAGLICFIGWLPVLIVGIIILLFGMSENDPHF